MNYIQNKTHLIQDKYQNFPTVLFHVLLFGTLLSVYTFMKYGVMLYNQYKEKSTVENIETDDETDIDTDDDTEDDETYNSIENLKQEISNLERDNRLLRRNNNKLVQDNEELEYQLSATDKFIQENVTLQNNIRILNEDIRQLTTENAELIEHINNLEEDECNDLFNDKQYAYLLKGLEFMTKEQLNRLTSSEDRQKILPGVQTKRKLKYTALYNFYRKTKHLKMYSPQNRFDNSQFIVDVKKFYKENYKIVNYEYNQLFRYFSSFDE